MPRRRAVAATAIRPSFSASPASSSRHVPTTAPPSSATRCNASAFAIVELLLQRHALLLDEDGAAERERARELVLAARGTYLRRRRRHERRSA
jgi:hypothetical protein